MFRIIYTPSAMNVYRGSYDSLTGIILAARGNGAIIQEWDEQWKTWREI